MAIEWNTRVERTFTFEQLLSATHATLTDLLGTTDEWLTLRPILTEGYYGVKQPNDSPTAPPAYLETVHGPWPGEDASLVITMPHTVAATVVAVHSPSRDWPAEEAGWDDQEGGARCTAHAQRDGMSCVLTIATAIAAAKTTGSFVWDETSTLGLSRINEPDALTSHLRVEPQPNRIQLVNDLLSKTGLGLRWQPTLSCSNGTEMVAVDPRSGAEVVIWRR